MTNKEKCKEIMTRLFGEAAGSQVEDMSEEDCVKNCKSKVETFLGATTADKEFAGLQ